MGDGGGGGGEKPDPEFTGKDVKQIQLKSVPASMKHEVKGDMGAVSDKTPKDVVGACLIVHILFSQVVP